MSKHNKVNKSNYDQAGRLTPDEMARERARAIYMSDARRKFNAGSKQVPTRRAEPEPSPRQSEREEEE